MSIEAVLDQLDAALTASDLSAARDVAAQLKTTLSAQSAWRWFSDHEPESYDELLEKLCLAKTWYSRKSVATRSGEYELRHLIDVFEWCEAHGIAVAELGVRGKMGNYREADLRLRGVVRDKALSDQAKVEELRGLIRRIRKDRTRADTRAWARGRQRGASHTAT